MTYYHKDLKRFKDNIGNMVSLINLNRMPLTPEVMKFYWDFKSKHSGKNIFKVIDREMSDKQMSFDELLNSKIS